MESLITIYSILSSSLSFLLCLFGYVRFISAIIMKPIKRGICVTHTQNTQYLYWPLFVWDMLFPWLFLFHLPLRALLLSLYRRLSPALLLFLSLSFYLLRFLSLSLFLSPLSLFFQSILGWPRLPFYTVHMVNWIIFTSNTIWRRHISTLPSTTALNRNIWTNKKEICVIWMAGKLCI